VISVLLSEIKVLPVWMATLLLPVIRQCRNYFLTTFFEFSMVENVYRTKITVILTSDLFSCMSLWLWLCCRWRPVATSVFFHHLEKMQLLLFILFPSHLTIWRPRRDGLETEASRTRPHPHHSEDWCSPKKKWGKPRTEAEPKSHIQA